MATAWPTNMLVRPIGNGNARTSNNNRRVFPREKFIFVICFPAAFKSSRFLFSSTVKGSAVSILSEFKEFALKGNVMDLAVGVIIGAAFGKIVDSLVADVIMPVVGKIFGGLDFSNYFLPLSGQTATTLVEAKKAGAVLAYGNFATGVLNFLILAFIIFMMVKQMNRLKRTVPAEPKAAAEEVILLREIRDSLKR